MQGPAAGKLAFHDLDGVSARVVFWLHNRTTQMASEPNRDEWRLATVQFER